MTKPPPLELHGTVPLEEQFELRNVDAENDQLRDERTQLRMQLADHGETITRLEQENAELRKMLKRMAEILQRIDGINDNPACFNPMIDEVIVDWKRSPCDDAEFGMKP